MIRLLIFLCMFLPFYCSGLMAETSPSVGADFIFIGVVAKIETSPIERSTKNWIVSTKIEKVVSGNFDGGAFSFRIHSPAEAGLAMGKRYRFHATKVGDGYAVNEFQIEPLN